MEGVNGNMKIEDLGKVRKRECKKMVKNISKENYFFFGRVYTFYLVA